MRITLLVAAAAVTLAAAGAAMAQPPGGGGGGRGMLPDFATVDANHDGKVTKDELKAALPEQAKDRADQIFDRRDANKDGTISAEEWAAAPAGRGGGGGGGGAPPAPKQ